MTTQRLHSKSQCGQACTAQKASKLCADRAELDEERLELDRAARALEGQIKLIDDELMRFVKAEAGDDGLPVVELSRYRVEIIQADGYFSYKDNLIAEIGLEEFEKRKNAVPTKDKVQLTEKYPKAVAAARAKAAEVRTKRTTAGSAGAGKTGSSKSRAA